MLVIWTLFSKVNCLNIVQISLCYASSQLEKRLLPRNMEIKKSTNKMISLVGLYSARFPFSSLKTQKFNNIVTTMFL